MFVPLSNLLTPDAPPAMTKARKLINASRPRHAQVHVIEDCDAAHVLLADGSRLYRFDAGALAALADAIDADDPERMGRFLSQAGLSRPPSVTDQALDPPPLRALSLAIAQKCNLACTYCYAQEGSFGSPPKAMPRETAMAAVDLLLADVKPGERVNLAFLGGEPLTHRSTLVAATEYAAQQAAARGIPVTFSITTNGTLLVPEDAQFFEQHGFAVTISVDGIGRVHDRLRPTKGGQGSFDQLVRRVGPLLKAQRRMQVSARVTVTPANLSLRETLDGLIDLGFHGVGFSPMLSSPSGSGEMQAGDLVVMLDQMVDCGEEFLRRVVLGQRYPFTNMVNALREIHKGTHRPYPCGAGAGYLGVSADGELSACHRFVGDEAGAMGDLESGADRARQARWLDERHVHRQEPCRDCWARYLCGGGCHHEVIRRGRPACDFIRGWLHFCLESYVRLKALSPAFFEPPE